MRCYPFNRFLFAITGISGYKRAAAVRGQTRPVEVAILDIAILDIAISCIGDVRTGTIRTGTIRTGIRTRRAVLPLTE